MGDKLGRVHMAKQDFSKLQTRKMKGLKHGRDDDDEEGDEETASVASSTVPAHRQKKKKST